ncbi:TPA: hypothetical protein QIF01_003378 [Serratia marcescens]|nr:hypothetical protein [Serratia marcescens]
MKLLLIAAFIFTPLCSQAECWIVGNLKGQSQFSPEYKPQKDEAPGVYHISISNGKASLTLVDDKYDAGLSYLPSSASSMIGTSHGDGRSLIETWTITGDKKVIYTKSRANISTMNQVSSFVGDVIGKC